ncbi:MAG: methylated-DNA--[protein]-cysteine S-methyltransferase [Methylovirgula sp.]
MLSSLTFKLERVASPVGGLLVVTDTQDTLHALHWDENEQSFLQRLKRAYGAGAAFATDDARPSTVRLALDAYFAGDLQALAKIPVAMTMGTPFQREVWTALRTIPVGETLSYGALAAKIGRPKAVRAVGLANGANPIAIVVPCHRVIGADHALTGFGGGLDRKRWLLSHEGASYRG